jgi:hypothetical protein
VAQVLKLWVKKILKSASDTLVEKILELHTVVGHEDVRETVDMTQRQIQFIHYLTMSYYIYHLTLFKSLQTNSRIAPPIKLLLLLYRYLILDSCHKP